MKRSLLVFALILMTVGTAQAQKEYSFTIPEIAAFETMTGTTCVSAGDENPDFVCTGEIAYITNKKNRSISVEVTNSTIAGTDLTQGTTAWTDVTLNISASNISVIAGHSNGNAGTAALAQTITGNNQSVDLITGVSRVYASADVTLHFDVNQFAEPSTRTFTVQYTIAP